MPHRKDSHLPPEDLLPDVQAYISEQAMFSLGDRVVVGVSGGPDSVCLLDLLFRLRNTWRLALHVAHLNHRLRGDDSDADEAFVASLAADLGLPYHRGETDVDALARAEKTSTEAAARIARRTFFEGLRGKTGADRIALGHTRSDQAETLLLRLFRGAGMTGLGAIRPVRDGVWVRPLLAVPRSRIETYLNYRHLDSRQDKTNRDTRFTRNRIRLELLPHLAEAYNPRIEEILARTSDVLQREDDLMDQQADEALRNTAKYQSERKIILDATTVFGYHISLQRRVFQKVFYRLHAVPNAVRFSSIQNALNRLEGRSGAVQICPQLSACNWGGSLIFSRPTTPFQVEIRVPGHTVVPELNAAVDVHIRPAEEIRPGLRRLGAFRACLDTDCLGEKLLLRNRHAGDRFQPYGMSGTQKVSDLFINHRIPAPLRDEVPLLTNGDVILWAVGLRTAMHAAVTCRTQQVLDIVFRGGWMCSTMP